MKTCKFVLLIFISFLFCNGGCEERKEQYYLIIQNNSDKEIVFTGSGYSSVSQDTQCIKPLIKFEYENFIYSAMIKPYSSKKMGIDMIIEQMQKYNLAWSLGIFNRIDMDTMPCEEFKQKYPLKHEWKVTLADMEACDWILVYPPKE
jgi:hypothetical protein